MRDYFADLIPSPVVPGAPPVTGDSHKPRHTGMSPVSPVVPGHGEANATESPSGPEQAQAVERLPVRDMPVATMSVVLTARDTWRRVHRCGCWLELEGGELILVKPWAYVLPTTLYEQLRRHRLALTGMVHREMKGDR